MNNKLDIFLKCDISGIQTFIFNVPSEGAARELKRRSIYVENIAKSCLKELEIYFTGDKFNVLYNGGGNFYLDISTKKDVQEIQNKIMGIQEPYIASEIYPFIAFIEQQANLVESLNEVNIAVQKAKMQRPVSFELLDAKPINAPEVQIAEIKGINGQIPKGDFTWIAEQSDGDKKLAALKLDVDNLGSLFMERTESEYSLMSGELKKFFDESLLRLIKDENMQDNIYVVFSGGDDCFLIGSWNQIFNLVIILRGKFREFQKDLRTKIKFEQDKEITFSAGISVFTPHYPMLQMAEEVEDSLQMSKLSKYTVNGEKKEKDSVTVFGKTLYWTEFEKAQSLAYTLTDLINNKEESKSLLMIFRLVFPIDNEMPKVWRLKYFLRRNIKQINLDVVKSIFDDYEQSLLFRYLNQKQKNPDIYLVASRWAELLMKK